MANRRRRASGARKLLVTILLAVCAVALILYLTKGGGKVDNADLGLVEINEVMSSNKGSVPDETGDFPDWIWWMSLRTSVQVAGRLAGSLAVILASSQP